MSSSRQKAGVIDTLLIYGRICFLLCSQAANAFHCFDGNQIIGACRTNLISSLVHSGWRPLATNLPSRTLQGHLHLALLRGP